MNSRISKYSSNVNKIYLRILGKNKDFNDFGRLFKNVTIPGQIVYVL